MEEENEQKEINPFADKLHISPDEIEIKTKKKNNKSMLYTAEQVKQIVLDALEERDIQLREEYNQILHDRLREQFDNFTRFNQDYISRHLKKSDFSYLS